ncbi:MAG: hypothetical protein U9R39_07675 [Campylobacterota bacterium]|nr:hypothetical protein [Campylobacterota bacterium]
MNLDFNLPKFLTKILDKIVAKGGIPILVGGMVRDYFLEIESKDYDIEIYKIDTIQSLIEILKEFGDVNLVGASFGILKLNTNNMDIDFSFPRQESKYGIGHKGFNIKINSELDFKSASIRRDFTINSIGYDFKNNKILDPHNGINDINKKVLKYVDKISFIEDPLRVYRSVQFSARFNFILDADTKKLCKDMVGYDEFNSLSKERIFQEYKKLLLKSDKPSIGISLLREFNLNSYDNKTFKDIDDMVIFKLNDTKENLVLMFYFIYETLEQISDDKRLIKDIITLKKFEVPKIYLYKIKNVKNKAELISKKLNIMRNMPLPFVGGKELISLGYKPSIEFKSILNRVYQLQLDGVIASKNDAMIYLNKI